MAKDASLALHEAIYTALTGDATLMAKITDVFDMGSAAQDQAYPFVEIGEADAIDGDTKTSVGLYHDFDCHVWSDKNDRAEAQDIMGDISRILHQQTLVLTDHTLINLRRTDRVGPTPDIDPIIRHGIITFRCVTQAD